MIDESTMYWITRLDKLDGLLYGMLIVFTVVSVVLTVTCFISSMTRHNDPNDERVFQLVRWVAPVALLLFLLSAAGWLFVPTTKEYAAIKMIPALVNNPKVQDEAKEVYALAKEWLKDQVKDEVTPEKKK